MSQEDVDTLRAGYDRFNAGDMTALAQNVHENFVATDRDELPDPQSYSGIKGAIDAASSVGEGFEGYRIEPDEIFEPREGVVVVVATQSGRGTVSGALVEGTIVHLWRMRDGKASSMHAYSSREQALKALDDG